MVSPRRLNLVNPHKPHAIELNVIALQFRAEFFNTLNHANFGVPGVNISSGGFGQITQTSTEARIIQLALKYRFLGEGDHGETSVPDIPVVSDAARRG